MKKNRHELILNFIKNNAVSTQEEIIRMLAENGYNVTQATISRDIKELKLVKGHDSSGNYRYIYNANTMANKNNLSHYKDLFIKSVKSVDYSLNNVVIKCFTGMASTACVACDEMFGDMMLGSLAGDDTIIIVTRSELHSKILIDKINNIL